MKVRDLIFISELDQFSVAYQLNISYSYLSEIKNKKLSGLSRDLRLKIELFIIKNNLQEKIEQKYLELKKGSKPPFL